MKHGDLDPVDVGEAGACSSNANRRKPYDSPYLWSIITGS